MLPLTSGVSEVEKNLLPLLNGLHTRRVVASLKPLPSWCNEPCLLQLLLVQAADDDAWPKLAVEPLVSLAVNVSPTLRGDNRHVIGTTKCWGVKFYEAAAANKSLAVGASVCPVFCRSCCATWASRTTISLGGRWKLVTASSSRWWPA
jgi:hypothetical protein